MIQSLLEALGWLLLRILGSVVVWIILFPVMWIVSLPVILVSSLFQRRPYLKTVADRIQAVHEWWKECGLGFDL